MNPSTNVKRAAANNDGGAAPGGTLDLEPSVARNPVTVAAPIATSSQRPSDIADGGDEGGDHPEPTNTIIAAVGQEFHGNDTMMPPEATAGADLETIEDLDGPPAPPSMYDGDPSDLSAMKTTASWHIGKQANALPAIIQDDMETDPPLPVSMMEFPESKKMGPIVERTPRPFNPAELGSDEENALERGGLLPSIEPTAQGETRPSNADEPEVDERREPSVSGNSQQVSHGQYLHGALTPEDAPNTSIPTLEATLVLNAPDRPIYDATLIQAEPRWKRHRKTFIIVLCTAVITAIAVGIAAPLVGNSSASPSSSPIDSSTLAPQTLSPTPPPASPPSVSATPAPQTLTPTPSPSLPPSTPPTRRPVGCTLKPTIKESPTDGSVSFNDADVLGGVHQIDKITKVEVYAGNFAFNRVVSQIRTTYRLKSGQYETITNGNGGELAGTFVLNDDDVYLQSIKLSTGNYVDWVQFCDNKGYCSNKLGGSTEKQHDSHLRYDRGVIKSFLGRDGKVIDRLRVYFEINNCL